MTPYQSTSGKASGVIAYEAKRNAIRVRFRSGEEYLYTYASAGAAAVEEMKRCAAARKGLSTYISRHDPPYERKY